jgi:dolichol-phosphate mannosyltransferase
MLWREHLNANILIIDDNSTDNTADIVHDVMRVYPDIHLWIRMLNHGLSHAVFDGFKYADSKIFIVMDADGQHPVNKIPILYRKIQEGYDLVIGSRYMPGGGIAEGWGTRRHVISDGATVIARFFFPSITDPVSGFFAVRKLVVSNTAINPTGYKILVEILGKGWYSKVAEIPYVFDMREHDRSKLRLKIIIEYVKQVFSLFAYTVKHPARPAYTEIMRAAKFVMVGITGIAVNLAVLVLCKEYLDVPLFAAGIVAVEVSILWNFVLNDLFTFATVPRIHSALTRLGMFNLISLGGMAITVSIMLVLAFLGMNYAIADIIGIFIAFAWNFSLNRFLTWGGKV